MADLIEYMPIFLVVLAGLFLVPFFIAVGKGIKADRRYAGKQVSIPQMAKLFEMLEGQQVVAFPCSQYIEPNKTVAIMQAMLLGTSITDAEGNEYIVKGYLKKHANVRQLFRDSRHYLVFAVQATGCQTGEKGVEFTFEKFARDNAERKAAVRAGELAEDAYQAWLQEQHAMMQQLSRVK